MPKRLPPGRHIDARPTHALKGLSHAGGRVQVGTAIAGMVFALALLVAAARVTEGFLVQGYQLGAGYDFSIFLHAAHLVLHGQSPFPVNAGSFSGDAHYVYPPLLALLAVPLTGVSAPLAVGIFAAAEVVALLLALFLLGVRDWRCYALAVLFQPARDAIGTGTIGPLLVLSVGLAWYYRDRRPSISALAVAAGIVLKLFLWPLLAWLVFTRRAAVAVVSGVAICLIAVVSWAAIGFDGLRSYPTLLRRLSHLEALKSYSAVALAHALGFPTGLAWAIALALAAGLLVAAARVARDPARTRDDRDAVALIYTVAAALVASPILWDHYLILVLVPLALARPRLSPLWFIPLITSALSYSGWEHTGWANGNLRQLFPPLIITALVFAIATRTQPEPPLAIPARST